MDGVRVISSVAVLLFVLLASFSAAREERSTRAAVKWVAVDQGAAKYLVLLKKDAPVCSGSIPSKWTVLTYCADASADGKTKAYAGLVDAADAADNPQKGIQERVVKSVAANNKQANLKICTLNKNWELTDKVGIVDIFVQAKSAPITSCTLLGYGGTGNKAQKLEAQTLRGEKCGDGSEDTSEGVIHSKVLKAEIATKALTVLDYGGPAICGDKQRAINKQYKAATTDADGGCNWFLDITNFSQWIKDEIKKAQPAGTDGTDGTGETGETGGTGGTGGNGTASSGYSIHSHLNKYSNWKVLWFLVPPIVAFLQY